MIGFPLRLKAHKRFEDSGSFFVADIDAECVFEVSRIVLDILDICDKHNTAQIRDSLRSKYQESEIDDAFRYLFQLRMAGILFQRADYPGDENTEFSGRIVVAPGFLDYLHQKPFLTRLIYHRLLKALGSELDIFIPIRSRDDSDSANDFDWEGANTFEVPDVAEINLARYYPPDCHGVLSMPFSSFSDISLSYSARVPTIFYVSSDEFDRQSVIDKYFLLREFDLLCVDSWWMKDYLASFASSTDRIVVLPTGVEEILYERQNPELAKSTVASAFQNDRMRSDPLVLLFLPDASYENRRLVHILAQNHPQIMFVVVDGIDRSQLGAQPENVEFFRVEDLADYQALPVILSASDVSYYSAVMGARGFYMSSLLRCGVPMIVSGHSDSNPMKDSGLYLRIHPDDAPSEVARMVSKNITLLLGNQDTLNQYRDCALRVGKDLTWSSVAKSVRKSFVDLREKLNNEHANIAGFPAFFRYYYDVVSGKLEPSAYERPTSMKGDFSKLIARELLQNHTREQVSVVIKHICEDKEAAEKILKQLT